jgi:carbamoyltransferase
LDFGLAAANQGQVVLALGGLMHDGNCCLLNGRGQPLFVGEEERFCRDKQRGGFPAYALSHLAKKYRLDLLDFSTVVLSRDVLPNERGLKNFVRPTQATEFIHVNHHLAHAAGAFYSSPFDQAAILTLDGLGDDICSIMAVGRGSRIEQLASLHYHNSLGTLWMRTGWFLGFSNDHFFAGAKVMALAAYGKPVYADVFLQLFRLHDDGTYELSPGRYPIESIARFWDKEKPFFLEQALGIAPRQPGAPIVDVHNDIAASMQKASEEVALHMVRGLHRRTGMENLCLAGGVALNCLQNTRLLQEGPFKRIYVVPNASDCGDGMGAALYHYHHNLGGARLWAMKMPYLGASYPTREMELAIRQAGVRYSSPKDIAETAAKALAKGKVIGWFQGAAEAGPRALGNRSILADPRRADVRDYINREIKHREWFRPFSPAVLAEKAAEYFACEGSFPYMLLAFPARPEKAEMIPGVLHVDMTARVQTVRRTDNPLFRRLIEAFYAETGVPVVLNTSFNDHGEPIVNSPADALRRFAASKLDALALGPFWVERE